MKRICHRLPPLFLASCPFAMCPSPWVSELAPHRDEDVAVMATALSQETLWSNIIKGQGPKSQRRTLSLKPRDDCGGDGAGLQSHGRRGVLSQYRRSPAKNLLRLRDGHTVKSIKIWLWNAQFLISKSCSPPHSPFRYPISCCSLPGKGSAFNSFIWNVNSSHCSSVFVFPILSPLWSEKHWLGGGGKHLGEKDPFSPNSKVK